jgi:lysophospholipase L1-like esterase
MGWAIGRARMGRLAGRVALAAAGLLAGVVFLEVLLQAGAWIVAATGRDLPVSWLTGNTRILCLGDSSTYGLWLERHEAYPQQLEAIWNVTPRAAPVEVLNLGFPGTNSSRLVRDFQRMIDAFEPDLVIVMIGANDFWTSPVELDSAEVGTSGISFLERHSRLWKFYGMVRRARDSTQLEVTFDPADAPESLAAAGTGSEAPARVQTSRARLASGAMSSCWAGSRLGRGSSSAPGSTSRPISRPWPTRPGATAPGSSS